MTEDEQQKLTVMMVELSSKVQTLLDKQDELAENINKIKEAVYNPDSGLYARLKELDIRIQHIESWKSTNTRAMWLVGGSVVGLVVQTAWKALF
mgnify:FL=1|tara:strand:+ start:136 stop:417 length:282 start_codon:yes stop_codon:yes gene_type:complete